MRLYTERMSSSQPMNRIIDTHCHLDFEVFDEDRDEVMRRAEATSIDHIVVPAVDIGNWDTISDLTREATGLHACYGLHPCYVERHRPEHLDALQDHIRNHDCIAVGECGLDYRDGMAAREQQQFYFERQLKIAENNSLPVIIHSVRATEDVIRALKPHDGLTGIVHSYSGSYEQAVQLHAMGFRLGFGGVITYDRARRLRDTVSKLPLEAIVLETDAPDQPDAAHHGERNEPAFIDRVVDSIAELRGEDREHIIAQTSANARMLLGL